MSKAKHYNISINRTARYYTLGPEGPEAEEIWFVLHGYGQLASIFIRHFQAIDSGKRLIVAPEALSRFYVDRSPNRIGASWMTREARDEEIQDYLAYLNQVAGHVLDRVESRQKPITVLGFSQGATTASRWVTEGRLPAKKLILWAGPIAHDLDLQTHGPTLSALTPAFVVGDDDYFITPDKLEEERARLDEHNINYIYVPFKGKHKMNKEVLLSLVDGT